VIVAEPRPLAQIVPRLRGYRKIHLLGCGSCVTVCRSGGEAEARDLARRLGRAGLHEGPPPELTVDTIERQCERDLVRAYATIPDGTDAILSRACGGGVQVVADAFEPLPVIPALSTTFMGGADEPGVWSEKCAGCGDCLLDTTAAICPITRCAKSLLNGPCGGSRDDRCEVSPGTPCAWILIYRRLVAQGRLHLITEVRPPRSWRNAGHGGVRTRRRTGVAGGPGDEPVR
jgi:ferredoxin